MGSVLYIKGTYGSGTYNPNVGMAIGHDMGMSGVKKEKWILFTAI